VSGARQVAFRHGVLGHGQLARQAQQHGHRMIGLLFHTKKRGVGDHYA
jgi:hypothetical protein